MDHKLLQFKLNLKISENNPLRVSILKEQVLMHFGISYSIVGQNVVANFVS